MTRIRRGQAYLGGMIYRMIAERRKDPRDRGDLLSMLLSAVDTEEAPEARPTSKCGTNA
jgi:cytochrome P450